MTDFERMISWLDRAYTKYKIGTYGPTPDRKVIHLGNVSFTFERDGSFHNALT